MTINRNAAQSARIRALVVVGVALLASAFCSLATLLYSRLSHYMYVEDLGIAMGLDEATIFAVTRATPVDRGIIVGGGILALLGVAALISAFVRGRVRRRSTLDAE